MSMTATARLLAWWALTSLRSGAAAWFYGHPDNGATNPFSSAARP